MMQMTLGDHFTTREILPDIKMVLAPSPVLLGPHQLQPVQLSALLSSHTLHAPSMSACNCCIRLYSPTFPSLPNFYLSFWSQLNTSCWAAFLAPCSTLMRGEQSGPMYSGSPLCYLRPDTRRSAPPVPMVSPRLPACSKGSKVQLLFSI